MALGLCGEKCKQPLCVFPWGGIDPTAPLKEAKCRADCMTEYSKCMARAAARYGAARLRCEGYNIPRLPGPRPMPIPRPR